MNVKDRLNSLLLRWQDELAQGRELSAGELCRECPELEPGLHEQLGVLRHMNALLQATHPPASTPDATQDSKPSNPDDDPNLTDFLAPPQADDELGRLGRYRILGMNNPG